MNDQQDQLIALRTGKKAAKRTGEYWTQEEVQLLVEHFHSGVGLSEMALQLERNEVAVFQQMAKMGLPPTRENIENSLNDIAGIRVICSYIDDIYLLADALTKQDDIRLIRKKDYIKNPKPNGYRSLHLIVSVPIFFAESTKEIRAEVQIRTIAMDFWASLEHQIKYKKNVEHAEEVIARLKECADEIAHVDETMLEIRTEMDSIQEKPTDIEALYEKLKKIDINLM